MTIPDSLGNDLYNFRERYHAVFDERTKTWRVIDLKHPEVSKIQDLDEEIPDENPAVTVIPEGMFSRLINEAHRLGIIGDTHGGSNPDFDELKEAVNKLTEEIKGNREAKPSLSEKSILKKDAMDKMTKLCISGDIGSETS